jgi:heme exporter protein A
VRSVIDFARPARRRREPESASGSCLPPELAQLLDALLGPVARDDRAGDRADRCPRNDVRQIAALVQRFVSAGGVRTERIAACERERDLLFFARACALFVKCHEPVCARCVPATRSGMYSGQAQTLQLRPASQHPPLKNRPRRANPPSASILSMLQAIDLECSRGFRTLFSGLCFAVSAGELLHVAGANGSGKTSLLRIVCGLLDPDSGEVRWKGAASRSLGDAFRRDVIYVGHSNGVKDELTPAENLRIACVFCGITVTPAAVDDALDALGLARYRNAPVKTLSQGQRRRVALARLALARDHTLWLLDEPWNALDEAATTRVQALVHAQLERGGVVVMTSHQQPTIQAGGVLRTLELPQASA